MTKRKSDFTLPTLDDLFTTQAERDDAKLERVKNIPLDELHPFKNHPFKVQNNEEMERMIESIRKVGTITPALARPLPDGGYELISGHRRLAACQVLGIETMPVIVREMSDDEAVIAMVDANLQRETILPSEKAFAYKMKLEAIKRQGERTDLTSSPLDKKLKGLTSAQQVSQKSGDSQPQIYRYIRLTELIPPMLDMVDSGKIAFRPAVELSYLSKEQQQSLYDTMECEDCTPSLAQAIKMKEFSRDGKLTEEVILSMMQEEKPNQREKPAFRDERITRLIPKSIPRGQETDFVIRALEFYNRHLQRRRDQER